MSVLRYSVLWADTVEFTICIDENTWTTGKFHQFLESVGIEKRDRSSPDGVPYVTRSELIPLFLRTISEDIVPVLFSNIHDLKEIIKKLKNVESLPPLDGSDGLTLEAFDVYSFEDSDFVIEMI